METLLSEYYICTTAMYLVGFLNFVQDDSLSLTAAMIILNILSTL
jgi:hypothetical protein